MNTDFYTKSVLTIIAAALSVIALGGAAPSAHAQPCSGYPSCAPGFHGLPPPESPPVIYQEAPSNPIQSQSGQQVPTTAYGPPGYAPIQIMPAQQGFAQSEH